MACSRVKKKKKNFGSGHATWVCIHYSEFLMKQSGGQSFTRVSEWNKPSVCPLCLGGKLCRQPPLSCSPSDRATPLLSYCGRLRPTDRPRTVRNGGSDDAARAMLLVHLARSLPRLNERANEQRKEKKRAFLSLRRRRRRRRRPSVPHLPTTTEEECVASGMQLVAEVA